ncbi:uncharacterized protein EI90DRAFT_898430 [Cantharellus anzutake]|uniref:uncharacterized protein n=1 Tax=Cantharellus anzutake TaxID=1750568 RepID=UPI001904881B|nr:uncharacterized protein EI90DRAFT_898430 [Cantharellus anzutake]KAF8331891.1 hypothetical protein EI90DRAFT_898430 [Cantharellus anzutake]
MSRFVIPNPCSPQRQGQQWTLERASPGQFYIKSHLNTYLNVDGPWRNRMRVIDSPNRQAWNIRVHGAASNTFRIFYPGTNSAVGLDRKYIDYGFDSGLIHLWGSNVRNSDQLWTFGLASDWNRFNFDYRPYLVSTRNYYCQGTHSTRIGQIVNREAGTAIGPSDDQKLVRIQCSPAYRVD